MTLTFPVDKIERALKPPYERFFEKKVAELEKALPRPPYRKQWVQSGLPEFWGETVDGDFVYNVTWILAENFSDRHRFHRSNRRRWAAWSRR